MTKFYFALIGILKAFICVYAQVTIFQETLKTLATYDHYVKMSDDGTIMMKANINNSVIVSIKNQQNFLFAQEILGSQVNYISMTLDNYYCVITRTTQITIYTFDSSLSIYTVFQILPLANYDVAIISSDHQNIAISSKTDRIIETYIFNQGAFSSSLPLGDASDNIFDIQFSRQEPYLITGGQQQIVRIYGLVYFGQILIYELKNQFLCPTKIRSMYFHQNYTDIIIAGLDSNLYRYTSAGLLQPFTLSQTLSLSGSPIISLSTGYEWNYILVLPFASSVVNIFSYDTMTGLIVPVQNYTNPSGDMFLNVAVDNSGTGFVFSSEYSTLLLVSCSILNCITCYSAAICLVCVQDYVVSQSGACVLNEGNLNSNSTITSNGGEDESIISLCVDNIFDGEICQQYCSKECQRCAQKPDNCFACTNHYILQENSCLQVDSPWNIINKVYSIVSFFRVRKVKSIFLLLDDFWLYQFHNYTYIGTIAQIFEAINFLQDKKDEVLGFEKSEAVISFKKGINIRYDAYTYQKYLSITRIDESILINQIDYLLQSLPLGIIIFLVIKIIFRLSYNYKISRFLRPLSFNGFLFVMLMEGEIERIAFLGFQNFRFLFSFNFSYKVSSVFTILSVFIFLLYAITSYVFLKIQYQQLSKYFLDNLFRIKFSTLVMTVIYGIRPFIKGSVQSILIFHNQVQLITLGAIDIVIILMLFWFELKIGLFRSKTVFSFLIIFLGSEACLNLLLYAKIKHSEQFSMLQQLLDKIIFNFIFVLIFSAAIQMFLAFFQLDFRKSERQKSYYNKKKGQENIDKEKKITKIQQSANNKVKIEKKTLDKKDKKQRKKHKKNAIKQEKPFDQKVKEDHPLKTFIIVITEQQNLYKV